MQYIFYTFYFLLWLITLFAWIYWFFLYKYFLFSRYSLIFFQLHLLSQFYMDDSLLFLLFLTLLLHTLFHLLHSMWPGELEKKNLGTKKKFKKLGFKSWTRLNWINLFYPTTLYTLNKETKKEWLWKKILI
jgi:hypothetical protein